MESNLQHRMVYFPSLPQNGQLNGLFSFLGGLLGGLIETAGKWMANLITTFQLDSLIDPGKVLKLTKSIADKAKNLITNIGTTVGMTGTADITTAEYVWIKAFHENKLKAYIQKLLAELKAATAITDDAQYIAAINAILNKVNGVNAHFNIETDSLNYISEKARRQFQYFIYECLRPVFDGANAAAAEVDGATEAQATFKIADYSFAPLFTSSKLTTITANNYKLGGATHTVTFTPTTPTAATTTTAVTPVKPVTPIKVLPITPVKTVPVPTASVPATTPVVPATTAPFTVQPVIKTGTETDTNTGAETNNGTGTPSGSKGLLILAAAGLTAWFLFGRKKKSKKSK